MKRNFTLALFLLLAGYMKTLAAGPTVPSNNLGFPVANIDGDRFNITFNKGNGAFRIVVMKEGSAVSTNPVNGTDYTNANAAFGTAGTQFNGSDGYVVFRGSNSQTNVTLSITKLNPNTTYYVSIWEFNGSGAATEYLLTPLAGNATTKAAPTGQAAITSFTQVAGNKLTLNWSFGNGEKRLIIGRKGAPVNVTPEQLKDYNASTIFGSGAVLNGDNYVLYKGSGSSTTITNLEPNAVYHFTIFEYNGNAGPVYMTPGSPNTQQTSAGPTQASGSISFGVPEGNRISLSFSPGNGKYQMIIGRKGQPVTAVPQNGQTYTASTVYGSGYQFPSGDFVLNYTGTDRVFSNMDPSSTYYFRIYDFDVDAAGNTYYLTGAYSEKPGNTAFPPSQQANTITFENVTGNAATIKYAPGDGAYRLVVMSENPVNAIPADLTRYNGNSVFGQGYQITPGNYVITGQTNSNTIGVTGLTPGSTYHVAIWGFNGNNYPIYATPAATAVLTIPNQPTTAGNSFLPNTFEANSFRYQWSGGDGARKLIIARKGAPVTAVPVDGTVYNADSRFEMGDMVTAGQYVVYDGTNRAGQLDNLEPGATYHLSIFEYNITGGIPDYLTSASLPGSGTTVSAPSSQANGLFASNIQNTAATINFSAGNGGARIFIMHAGSPVNADPQDFTSYGYSQTYGGSQLGNTGNYIVYRTSGTAAFSVSSLSPNTLYYVNAYEFNGSSAPAYLRPGASFSFTTTGSGITAPTANSSSPSFSLTDGNKLTLDWHKGDGAKRIVVMRQGNPVAFTPVDGVDYTANADFGNGIDQGSGQYIVNNSTQETVTVTNLQPATTYHFAIYEYNGTGAQTHYLLTGKLTAQGTTAAAPATGSTGATGVVNNLSITISWNSGPGIGKLVVMKEGSAVTGTPADLSKYPYNPVFGSGSQIATGEYVVFAGSGSSVVVTGLSNNKTYHFKIFDYNGVDAPIYNTVITTSNSVVISTGLPLKWLSFTAKEENDAIKLDWATTQEFNTSYFVVERSQSNGNFIELGRLAAKGSDIRNDYSYIDYSQPAGIVTYRIRQVDIDNKSEYSKQVTVRGINQQVKLKLYPNPAPGYTRISLPQNLQQASVKIYTLGGALVKTVAVTNGQLIDLQGLSRGVYQLVAADKSEQYSERLIVE